MFGTRRRLADAEARFIRSTSELIGTIAASRAAGDPVTYDSLPITVGAAQVHADMLSAMPARTDSTDGRVLRLLADPDADPDTDYRATIAAGTLAMFWKGYAPLLLDRPAPYTTSFRVLDPNSTDFDYDWRDPRTITAWRVNGEPVPVNRIYAVSLLDDPRHGPVGESPLRRCAAALEMYGYAYRHMIDYYAAGGNPSSILKVNHALTATRASEIVDEWITARQTRRPAVMDPMVSLEVPPVSGELDATIRVLDHAAAEVGRLLNMPGSLINAPSLGAPLTYTNVADEFRRWLVVSLKPTYMARWESAFRTLSGADDVWLDPGPLLDTFTGTGADSDTGVSSAPVPAPEPNPLRMIS